MGSNSNRMGLPTMGCKWQKYAEKQWLNTMMFPWKRYWGRATALSRSLCFQGEMSGRALPQDGLQSKHTIGRLTLRRSSTFFPQLAEQYPKRSWSKGNPWPGAFTSGDEKSHRCHLQTEKWMIAHVAEIQKTPRFLRAKDLVSSRFSHVHLVEW